MEKTKIKEYEKNFFWSANSEAYQDAFLVWVFKNFGTQGELGDFSKYFTEKLINLNPDNEHLNVLSVGTIDKQVKDSDISFTVQTQDGAHLVIIEDKTGSALHSSKKYRSQLDKYFEEFEKIEKYKDMIHSGKCHLIVYKNQIIGAEEKASIEKSNEFIKGKGIKFDKTPEWLALDIDAIYGLFKSFLNEREHFDDAILDSYYQNLSLWRSQYESIRSDDFTLTADMLKSPFWQEKSWLWQAFFDKMASSVFSKKELEEQVVISTYNGAYWQLSIHARDNRTVMLLSSRSLLINAANNSSPKILITVNLRNAKYGDRVPWKDYDERDTAFEEIRTLISKLEISGSELKLGTLNKKYDKKSDESHCGNLLATYSFALKALSIKEIEKEYAKVLKVFRENID